MHPEGNGRSGFLIHGERQKDKLLQKLEPRSWCQIVKRDCPFQQSLF
ncbi:SPRED2 isoform 7, partial [Pongo abelii]